MHWERHFQVIGAVFIGVPLDLVEQQVDLNEVPPDSYILDYNEDPDSFWEGHDLEYFAHSDGFNAKEWVGISLDQIQRYYGEWSLNDIRMKIMGKLGVLGADIDFSDVDWYSISTVVEI